MSNVFRFPYHIGLHDTDAAGLIYAPNIIRVCLTAYEAMLRELGFGMDLLFARRTMSMPIVHIEADFMQMLTVGRAVEIVARVEHIGTSSYRMAYEIMDGNARLATAATVQVCVDPKTRASIPIPEDFRKALERYAS